MIGVDTPLDEPSGRTAAALFWLPRKQTYWADLLAVYDPLGPSEEVIYKGTETNPQIPDSLFLYESPGGVAPLQRLFDDPILHDHRLLYLGYADAGYDASDQEKHSVFRPFPGSPWSWCWFADAAAYRQALRPHIPTLIRLPTNGATP